MTKFFKILLLVFIVIVLFIPLLQQEFKVLKVNEVLYGSFEKKRDTMLSVSNWFNRAFQEKKEDFVNENFGFRTTLLKLNNELNFSFYGDIVVGDVFKGKNNYLFSHRFYANYSGRNFNGEAYADSVFETIEKLTTWLEQKNVKLLICFTPCKESFCPEYLPDTCITQLREQSFYKYYRKRIINSKIPLLDYQDHFQNLKRNSKYPLFTQGAVHWTEYGATLALDTLLKRVAFETKKKVNGIRVKSVELSDTSRGNDDDISKAMNLLRNINSEKLAYPAIEYLFNQDSCYKPKVLLVGDSFYYGLNNTWIPGRLFSNESYFLYYFYLAIPYNSEKKDVSVPELDFNSELENTDFVILFFSLGNLDKFPYNVSGMMDEKKP